MLSAPALGDVVSGRYRLVRVRARGASAIVFEAVDARDGQRLALKILRPEVIGIPGLVARFEQEGRLLASMTSPNVVRVYDLGTTDAGLPYLALELLEGNDLGAELARGLLDVGRAARIVRQVCAALAEAHDRGIVHRDIKPANLFLAVAPGGQQTVKVLDFGISKKDEAGSELTTTGVALGTPVYMPPEQLLSARDADPRCDVWALGVVLFELVTGRAPFEAFTAEDVARAILSPEPAPRVSAFRAGVPEAFEEVVARCLDKDAGRRMPSVRDLAGALAPFESAVEPPTLARPHSARAPAAPPRRMRGATLALAITAGVTIGVLAITIVILATRRLTHEPSFAELFARAAPTEDSWRPCLVAGEGTALPALAFAGARPEIVEDVDVLVGGGKAPMVRLAAPWTKDAPADEELVIVPVSPLAPAFRRAAADVILVTDKTVMVGRVNATLAHDVSASEGLGQLDSLLSGAPRIIVVEGETPVTKLVTVARKVGNLRPVALGVISRARPPAVVASGEANACPDHVLAKPRTSGTSSQIDAALKELAQRCARAAPDASGTLIQGLLYRNDAGSAEACVESSEIESTRLSNCVAAGLESAAKGEIVPGAVLRFSVVLQGPEPVAVCDER